MAAKSSQEDLNSQLWFACLDGDIKRVEELIHQGADLKYTKESGKTLLAIAAYVNHDDLVELLAKKHKADPDTCDESGRSPLTWACAQVSNVSTCTAKTLVKCGANVNSPSEDVISPLITACHTGNLEIIKLFVRNGADRKASYKNQTPQQAAEKENHTDVVDYLLEVDKYEKPLKKAIAEESAEIEFTKFSIHGPAGSGKTCLQHLILNEPPPEEQESTNLVTSAVLSTARDASTSVMASVPPSCSSSAIFPSASTNPFSYPSPLSIEPSPSTSDPSIYPSPLSIEPSSVSITDTSASTSTYRIQRVDEDKSLQLLMQQTKSKLQLDSSSSTAPERSAGPDGATPMPVEASATPKKKENVKKFPKPSLKVSLFKKKDAQPDRDRAIHCDSSEPTRKSLVSCGLLSVLPTVQGSGATHKLRWIYGTDSGGQSAFQDVAPAFLRHCSVVILTLKLNERLDEYPKLEYKHKGSFIKQNGRTQLTNLQMVLTLARSLSSVLKTPCESDSTICKPKLMIVGTFYDLMESCSESLAEKNAILKKELEPFDDILIRYSDGTPIHPIWTLIKDGRERCSEKFCKSLLNFPGLKQALRVPLSQLVFQFEILMYAESKNKEILDLEDCYEVGRSVQIFDKRKVEDALKYLDTIGILFYFHEVLPNIVFVKPQAILKYLSDLVSFSFFENPHLFSEYHVTSKDHRQLCTDGCFSRSLLEALFHDHQDTIFTVDGFIKLMKHLLVLAEVPVSPNFTKYFLPCVLPWEDLSEERTSSLLPISDVAPILLTWDEDKKVTSAIPYGIFLGTINGLLLLKDELQFTLLSSENTAYKNLRNAVFLKCSLDGSGGCLLLLDRVFHIELRFKGHTSCCHKILSTVKHCIATAAARFHYHGLDAVVTQFMSPCETEPETNHLLKVEPGSNAFDMHGQMSGMCIKHPENNVKLTLKQSIWFENKALVYIDISELPQERELENADVGKIFKALRPIASNWTVIGHNMGLEDWEIKRIEQDRASSPNRVTNILIDIICKWLKKDSNCTASGLRDVLTEIHNVKVLPSLPT